MDSTMYGWMDGWMCESITKWIHGWIDELNDVWMNGWVNEWMEKIWWIGGWVKMLWLRQQVHTFTSTFEKVSGWVKKTDWQIYQVLNKYIALLWCVWNLHDQFNLIGNYCYEDSVSPVVDTPLQERERAHISEYRLLSTITVHTLVNIDYYLPYISEYRLLSTITVHWFGQYMSPIDNMTSFLFSSDTTVYNFI